MQFTHVGPPREFTDLESVTHPDGRRFYTTPDGRVYPSITTVLSAGSKGHLDEWRKRVGEEEALRVSTRATLRGTRFHKLTEDYLNNQPVKPHLLDAQNFTAFKPVLHRINNIRIQEVALYSHYLRLAGRTDCIGDFDGKLSIIDFKTATQPKRPEWIYNYFKQAAGYAIMWEEMTGIPIGRLAILISVDDDEPQVFVERRDAWAKGLIVARDAWEATHGRA